MLSAMASSCFVGVTWAALSLLAAAESSPSESDGPAWDGLKVTFGLNPFNSMYFNALPRTLLEAETAGWKLDATVTCGSGSPFIGDRYKLGSDTSVMLLFDKNGYVAGTQTGIPKTLPNNYPAPNLFKAWIEETNTWTITAYFVEPSTICSTGRSTKEFNNQGTGTSVIIQTGPNASTDRVVFVNDEKDLAGTKWVKGVCFYWMGMHYWYNLRVNMTADEFFPAFPLYNGGKLTAFGWAFVPNVPGDRYEHPSRSIFGTTIQTPPDFLMRLPLVTTMHHYMTNSPRLNFC